MFKYLVFAVCLVSVVFAAGKAITADQVEAAVSVAMPPWIIKQKIITDNRGNLAQLVSIRFDKTAPVTGWSNTWSSTGKVRLSNGQERGFEARVSVDPESGHLSVSDITLGH